MSYLVDHAVENVWCAPEQDKQAIMELKRLTGPDGDWIHTDILKRRYKLPNAEGRFHVFSIGQLFPELIGMFPHSNVWTTISECCNKQNMMADVYTSSGIRLASSFIWYRWTEDKALVVAIEQKKVIPINYGTEKIFFQVYSDAYFKTRRSDAGTDSVYVYGKVMTNPNDILAFQLRVNNYKAKAGKVVTFLNGFYCDSIDLINTKAGDLVEMVHDTTIEQVVRLKIGELDTFNSELDKNKKYLIHFEKTAEEPTTIRFIDDIYLYLAMPDSANRRRGVYYHKNAPQAFRMVTHRDYSISVDNVIALSKSDAAWTDPEKMEIILYFRKSGYLRTLQFETNRIHELYKLAGDGVRKALLGFDSNVDVWRAEHLEKSAYIELMKAVKLKDFTEQMVEDAYGYNAISTLVGFTPKKTEVVSNQAMTRLPLAAAIESAVFEFDFDGKMVGYRSNVAQEAFACSSNSVSYVEALAGRLSTGFDEYYTQKVVLDPKQSYRFYAKANSNNKWVDVTGTDAVVILNGVAHWTIPLEDYKTVVRSDRNVLVYDIDLQPYDGVYDLVLQQVQNKTGSDQSYEMVIPPGTIDVFFNKRLLIEGLDYFVKFPKIVIVNKEYLNLPSTNAQKVTVRCRGFCKSDLSRWVPEDIGFVQYGMLSRNSIFNLRDDRVMRVTIDGCIYTRDEVKYIEGATGMSVGTSVNGKPYAIQEITVPVKSFTPSDTYVLQEQAHAVNKEITDYLSLMLPEPERTDIFTATRRYYTYSPFCTKLLFDMLRGVLNDARIKEHCSDTTVREICEPYLHLLEFDPCADENRPDDNFVYVHPHHLDVVVDVDAYIFKFLSSAVRIFLQNRVDLSSFLRIVF